MVEVAGLVLADQPAPAALRRLDDGSQHRIVKVFHDAQTLTDDLTALGWSVGIRSMGWNQYSSGESCPELVVLIVLFMVRMVDNEGWAAELELVFARVAGRLGRADLRWRMRDCVRGLLAPVARKNG